MLPQMRPWGTQWSQKLPWGKLESQEQESRLARRVAPSVLGQMNPVWKVHYQLVSL